jgi:hypothetical protein
VLSTEKIVYDTRLYYLRGRTEIEWEKSPLAYAEDLNIVEENIRYHAEKQRSSIYYTIDM